MDEKLEQALDFSNFRQTLHNQQQTLLSIVNDKLLFSYDNQIFKATPETIGLVKTIVDLEYSSVVIDDVNSYPANITNPVEFLNKLISVYSSAKNEHFVGYKKIQKARSINKLVNVD